MKTSKILNMLHQLSEAVEKSEDYDELVKEVSRKGQKIINLESDIKSLAKERETQDKGFRDFISLLRKRYNHEIINEILRKALRT